MFNYYLKSYSQKEEIKKPHFFILNKGNNSGKPLLSPCSNCFTIQFESTEENEQVYWLLYCLWQSSAFYPYLRGSVIPFIILRDLKSCLNENLKRAGNNPVKFHKMVDSFQAIYKIENQLKQNLKAIEKAKKMLLFQFVQ